MKKTILQHCTVEQKEMLELVTPFNKAYADKLGFDYIPSDMNRRMPDHPLNFEKIGYINEMLPKLEEGSLVVWLDADAVCVRTDESFEKALGNGEFGMVRCLHGLGMRQVRRWWNIGTVVMKNTDTVRSFITRIAKRTAANDEIAMMEELHENGFMLGNGVGITSIDNKWNCWRNNQHIEKNPVVVSFHGYTGLDAKIAGVKTLIAKLPK